MYKKLLSMVLVFSIIAISIVPVHAIDNYGITKDWSYNAIITYEALSELAAQVASDLADGNCPSQFYGAHVDMRYNGTYWHIKIITPSDDIYYVGMHTDTVTSGTGTVYVATASQITQVLWNIESLANTISNKVTSIDNNISSINTKITSITSSVNSIFGMLQQTYFCSYSVDANDDPYPINHISRATGDYLIAELNMKMQGKKIQYINQAGGMSDYYFVSAYYNQAGYIAMTITTSNQSAYYNVYLCDSRRYMFVADRGSSGSSAFDDTDLLNAIDDLNLDITNSIGDLGVTVNQSIAQNLKVENPNIYGAATSSGVLNISNSTMDAMIAFLNSNMLGKPINFVNASDVITEYYLRGAYKSNNKIRVTMEDSNGNTYSTTAYLCNKYRSAYTVDITKNTIEGTILNIPTHIDALGLYLQELGIKLDNIYNWLDNADLVTNQDLEDMIQEFSSDIDNAENNVKNGAKLFKATFGSTDDGYSLGDILSCINTMHDFWGDPE